MVQPRPNTASHQSGDLVVANQPSGQTIPDDTLDRAKQIIDGLEKRGLDPVTAAAFAANAIHESVAKPNNTGDMGNAHGLMMWTDKDVNGQPGRAVKFRQAEGGNPEGAPLDKQLDFIVKELHGDESGAWAAIQSAQGVAAKTAAVSKYYERPKDVDPEQARRSATGLQLAQQLGLPGAAQAASAGGPATAAAATPSTASQPAPAGGAEASPGGVSPAVLGAISGMHGQPAQGQDAGQMFRRRR